MPLTPEERQLITFEGFESAYHRFIAETSSNQEAYEKAESLVENAIGQRLFKSYDAFRVAQSRRLARRSEHVLRGTRLGRYGRGKE